MEKCPFCLAETRPGARFCLQCGNRLTPDKPTLWANIPQAASESQIAPTQRSGESERDVAHLILFTKDGQIVQEHSLNATEISIGRAHDNTIVLLDGFVSRHHAVISYQEGNYVLLDKGSTKGTSINGLIIEKMVPYMLSNGDRIGVGEHELFFRSPESYKQVEDMPTVVVPSPDFHTQREGNYPEPAKQNLQSGSPYSQPAPPSGSPYSQPAPPYSYGSENNTVFAYNYASAAEGWQNLTARGEDPSQLKAITRFSNVSFPEHIVVSQESALRVAITREALNELAIPLALELPEDKAQLMEVDVCVVVSPLDFSVKGPNVRTIIVPLEVDSLPTIFKLTAKSIGKKIVGVEFFQNSRYLGRVEMLTTAMQQGQAVGTSTTPVATEIAFEVENTISPPDLTILFDRVPVGNDKHYYRYRLLSPLRELNLWFDEFRSPETNVLPQSILEDTFKQLNNLISSTNPDSFFFGRLNSIGMSLYRRLVPDDFKRFYWNKLRDRVKNIVIISFEPWIPWELMRPFNVDTNEAEDGFLCEKFNLTRWLAGAGFPDTLSLEQLGLIVSASSLDAAKLESEEIRRILGAKVRDVSSSSEAIYHLLRTSELSGLHFACHGAFNRDNPDMSTVKLEDGTWISPIDIDGDGLIFGKNKPLVFLNACETGQSGYALTGMGGWAEAFIGRAKCSGFIGSIWKANDESACKFAVEFYRNLLDGKTIAEAARIARLAIKQAGDPTWLSYTIYANPLARLSVAASLAHNEINSEQRNRLFSYIYRYIYQQYGYANQDSDEILDIVRHIQHEANKGERAKVKKIECLLEFLNEIAPTILSSVIECLANPDVGIALDVRTMTGKFVTHM